MVFGERGVGQLSLERLEDFVALCVRVLWHALAGHVVESAHASLGHKPLLHVGGGPRNGLVPLAGEGDGLAVVGHVEEVVDAGGFVHAVELAQPLEHSAVEFVGQVEDVVSRGIERVKEGAAHARASCLGADRAAQAVLQPQVAH